MILRWHHKFYISLHQNNFLMKDMHVCCFNNYTTTSLFFFLEGTIDSLNRTWSKQNLRDWYVCFHYFDQGWENCWRFHTCVENCMYAHTGLDFVSCCKPKWETKKSQSSGCNHHYNYHQKLRPASMLSGRNFYHSRIFFVHRRLSCILPINVDVSSPVSR